MDVFPDGRTERIAYEAFSGSLDAAKALHEALLPGCGLVEGSDRFRAALGRHHKPQGVRLGVRPAAGVGEVIRALSVHGFGDLFKGANY